MKCPHCRTDRPLDEWRATRQPCIAECTEDQARICPGCGNIYGHTWLDSQTEFKHSEWHVTSGTAWAQISERLDALIHRQLTIHD